ncbi:MAG: hypothetical protein K8U57_26110 [Planctomycetes bacterium]|nr:hypothetical protein [Planctomycetota bacterium]
MAVFGFSEGKIFDGVIFLLIGTFPLLMAIALSIKGDDRSPKITLSRTGFKHHPSGYEIPWTKVLNVRAETKVLQVNGAPTGSIEAKLFIRSSDEPGMETIIDVYAMELSPQGLVDKIREWSSREFEGENYVGPLAFVKDTRPAAPAVQRRYRVTTSREDGSDVQVHEVEGTSREDVTAFAVLTGMTVVDVKELPE